MITKLSQSEREQRVEDLARHLEQLAGKVRAQSPRDFEIVLDAAEPPPFDDGPIEWPVIRRFDSVTIHW